MNASSPPLAIDNVIEEAISSGARIVFSLSGGKDSSAAAFAAKAYLDSLSHPEALRHSIHADLGAIEWPSTMTFVEDTARRLRAPLTTVRRGAGGLIQRWNQRWASSLRRYENLETYQLVSPWSSASLRFCTSEAKVSPIGSQLRRSFAGDTIISVIGIRREESASRAKTPISKIDTRFAPPGNKAGTRMLAWHPILDWTTEQVFAFHRENDITLHEAYGFGSTRLSCSFCVLSSLNNLQVAVQSTGNLEAYKRIVALESRSAFSFQNTRWLADIAPTALDATELKLSDDAKQRAEKRRELEAILPQGLRFKRGWPPRVPTMTEAKTIADVRGRLLEMNRLRNNWPTASLIRDRFADLHAARAN